MINQPDAQHSAAPGKQARMRKQLSAPNSLTQPHTANRVKQHPPVIHRSKPASLYSAGKHVALAVMKGCIRWTHCSGHEIHSNRPGTQQTCCKSAYAGTTRVEDSTSANQSTLRKSCQAETISRAADPPIPLNTVHTVARHHLLLQQLPAQELICLHALAAGMAWSCAAAG